MKLLSFELAGSRRFGAWVEGGIVDLTRRVGGQFPDLLSVLQAGALPKLAEALKGAKPDVTAESVKFLPVIPNPPKIICIGINYEEHRAETGRDPTLRPPVFARFANSQVGHQGAILLPPESEKLDYEGEIAVIIGKAGRRISEKDSWDHIAGYSCYNDGSVRDWQWATTQWTAGKNFAATGGFGPWMVTADEIPAETELTLITRLNGVEMQHTTTDLMVHSIPKLIAHLSTWVPLAPGDVIVSGTPGGVGARRDPPVWMKPGDMVEIEVSRVGVLRNTIEDD